MKVRAYVLIASVALLGMSAGSKKAKLTEGVNPGDLAPRIEFLGNDAKASFHNQLGRYTLLNFWAAYDAESRARNVQLANEVNKFGPDKTGSLVSSWSSRKIEPSLGLISPTIM